MIVGVPKELKTAETRVGLNPTWVKKLTAFGHEVLIQSMAGEASGFCDEEYVLAGAKIVNTIDEIYEKSEFVVKVKELQPYEYGLLRENQMIMAWFHLAEDVNHEMTQALLDTKAISLSMELIVLPDGTRPTIKPMSEIAGTLAMLEAVKYAQYGYGGKGILLRKLAGLPSSKVFILGGGNAGLNTAQVAVGLGLNVTIMEASMKRIDYLNNQLPQVDILCWDKDMMFEELIQSDVLINTIYPMPGVTEPLITREMVSKMKPNSIIIDIAGTGIIETSRYTTLEEPVYYEQEVLHYCVPNMPALCPQTSTNMMLMTTGPYIMNIANNGLKDVIVNDVIVRNCISTLNGEIVHHEVGINHNMPYTDINTELLLSK
ncbi:alanine dehydrogenase [Peribacillus butanolivorans]|uniref:alanine dehydrogenase n=1 Tax=Peribacillus butanolivorans TaxID=421767 RepID=UPI002E1B7C15|nr:alanine dehydrogenase [Peribacillus butanolivorans]